MRVVDALAVPAPAGFFSDEQLAMRWPAPLRWCGRERRRGMRVFEL
jgi:hypothetical protein